MNMNVSATPPPQQQPPQQQPPNALAVVNPIFGLLNSGNTCFLNVCIQLLNVIPELYQFIKDIPENTITEKIMPDIFLYKSWLSLTNNILISSSTPTPTPEQVHIFNPIDFAKMAQKVAQHKKMELFVSEQNDFSECFQFILECIHTAISKSQTYEPFTEVVGKGGSGGRGGGGGGRAKHNTSATKKHKHNTSASAIKRDTITNKVNDLYTYIYKKDGYSPITELFGGVELNIMSNIDHSIEHNASPMYFSVLNLPIATMTGNASHPPKTRIAKTLTDCFDFYTESELLYGENAWVNEKTNQKEPAHKTTLFWSLPKILVIIIKRNIGTMERMNSLIEFPITDDLDLSKYIYKNATATAGHATAGPANGPTDTYKYSLFGICNHIGDVHSGHYTCFIKTQPKDEKEQPFWIHINDHLINRVDEPKQMMTPMTYGLLYRLRE